LFETKPEYYRREHEKVYFIRNEFPIEVKYQSKIKLKELRGLLKFMENSK
jgi:hypothetical protein